MKKDIFVIFFVGLMLCLCKIAQAEVDDINLASLPTTSHYYINTFNDGDQGISSGPLTFDGNFSTYMGNSAGAQGNTSIVSSQHTFARPVDIHSIQYRMRAGGHCGGSYEKSADYEVYIQYKVGGVWYYLPGSQASAGTGNGSVDYDTPGGAATYSTPLNSVTDILAYAKGQGHGEDRASNGSYAEIYEIQVWGRNYVDMGLRAYDGANIIKIACQAQGSINSPLKFYKNGVVYSAALVELSDSYASKFRVKTSSGIKALAKLS